MSIPHILLAIMVTMIWGSNFIIMKFVAGQVTPFMFTALRCALIGSLALFIPKPNVPWKTLITIGVLIGMMKIGCLVTGIHAGLPAGLASITLQTQSLFSVIFALVIFKEYPKANNVIGMLVSFAGIALIALQIAHPASLTGFFWVLAAAIAWGASNLVVRTTKGEKMVNVVVWWSLVPPIPMMILSYLFEGPTGFSNLLNIQWTAVVAVFISAFVSMFVGYTVWGYLMQKNPISMVAPFSLLVPVTAITLSYFIFDETLSVPTFCGIVMVIIGLIINQWHTFKRAKA